VLALLGLGGGICFPALMGLSMADVKPEDAGLASGLIGTMGEVGAALGLAVLATLSATRTETLAAAGKPALDALTGGFHLSFAIAAVIVAASVVIACTLMRPTRSVEVALVDDDELVADAA
jgi:MFS family permease